jgi:hypothetical protein
MLQCRAALPCQLLCGGNDEARTRHSQRAVRPLFGQQFQRGQRAIQYVRLQLVEAGRERIRILGDAGVVPACEHRAACTAPTRQQQATLSGAVAACNERSQESPAAADFCRAILEYRQRFAA